MSEQKTAFPLYWPASKPRAKYRNTNRSFKASFSDARDECEREIRRLGGTGLIISSNVPLRRDGKAYFMKWGSTLPDPGVAVYFKRNGREMCFACDCWAHVQDNMHAVVLTIAALRGIARWGTGDMMEAAFVPVATGVRSWECPSMPTRRPLKRLIGFWSANTIRTWAAIANCSFACKRHTRNFNSR